MNANRDDINLDELIGRAIDGARPEFDAESWKSRYTGRLDMLGSDSQRRDGVVVRLLRNRVAQLAAAAVLIIAATVLVVRQGPVEPENRGHFTAEPAQMTTAQSLREAFHHGGLDALETQCDEATKVLGPTVVSLRMPDVL